MFEDYDDGHYDDDEYDPEEMKAFTDGVKLGALCGGLAGVPLGGAGVIMGVWIGSYVGAFLGGQSTENGR